MQILRCGVQLWAERLCGYSSGCGLHRVFLLTLLPICFVIIGTWINHSRLYSVPKAVDGKVYIFLGCLCCFYFVFILFFFFFFFHRCLPFLLFSTENIYPALYHPNHSVIFSVLPTDPQYILFLSGTPWAAMKTAGVARLPSAYSLGSHSLKKGRD